jgi:hypothetical protein
MAVHNIDSLSTSYLEVTHPVLGAALNVPTSFIPPGSANIFQCFVGSAYNKVINASLVVGSNVTNPQALSVTGDSNFLGSTTILGNLTVAGAPLGGPKGSGVGKLGGATEIAGKNFKVTALSSEFSSSNFMVTAATRLELNGPKSVAIRGAQLSVDCVKSSFQGSVSVSGVADIAAAILELRVTKKTFDILHPNKPGYRLRHACVEGPEAAVYIRGRLHNNNIIELPDYWNGLVDPETITVNLTQIGHTQDLIVEKIEWGRKVIIKSGNGTSINCYYHIWADRLGEKLIVEYEGKTPDDYPGDNTPYSIAGWNYDIRDL